MLAILPTTPFASAAILSLDPPKSDDTVPRPLMISCTAGEHSRFWMSLARERLNTGAACVFKTVAEMTRARRVAKRAIFD